MATSTSTPLPLSPTRITLSQKVRTVAVSFNDGAQYVFPCQYLRVFTIRKNVIAKVVGPTPKGDINIISMEPFGHSGIKFVFEDGYRTPMYSWLVLHKLGELCESTWRVYQEQLALLGLPPIRFMRRHTTLPQ